MTADAVLPPPPVKVKAHPGLCEGWGECHRSSPQLYPLDAEGKIDVHVMDVPSEHAEDAWRGAVACPNQAITIIGPPEDFWYDRLRHRSGRTDHTPEQV